MYFRFPFNLIIEKDRLLMARYLIENNEDEIIYLDLDKRNINTVVLSIFKSCIKKYEILKEEKIKWNNMIFISNLFYFKYIKFIMMKNKKKIKKF